MAESNCYAKGVYGFHSAIGPSDIMNVVVSFIVSQDTTSINKMLQPNHGRSVYLYTAPPCIYALRKRAIILPFVHLPVRHPSHLTILVIITNGITASLFIVTGINAFTRATPEPNHCRPPTAIGK